MKPDINWASTSGRTALSVASFHGILRNVDLLLMGGAYVDGDKVRHLTSAMQRSAALQLILWFVCHLLCLT
jgi:hypothetical protein